MNIFIPPFWLGFIAGFFSCGVTFTIAANWITKSAKKKRLSKKK